MTEQDEDRETPETDETAEDAERRPSQPRTTDAGDEAAAAEPDSSGSRTRATSPPTTSRSSSTSPTSTATWTWTSRATGPRSRSSAPTCTQLVGRDGEVLEALQELTRLAVYRETGERSRLMLDISGYRAEQARGAGGAGRARRSPRCKESGEPVSLDPMTPFERKVVHDAVAAAGLTSESEGVEPRRYVVVLPGVSRRIRCFT